MISWEKEEPFSYGEVKRVFFRVNAPAGGTITVTAVTATFKRIDSSLSVAGLSTLFDTGARSTVLFSAVLDTTVTVAGDANYFKTPGFGEIALTVTYTRSDTGATVYKKVVRCLVTIEPQ